MKDEIFLSYAREDRERAKIFADALEKLGYSVWWDRKMLGGGRIDSDIQEKLDTAKCVIVLWSRSSVGSDWVIDEVDTGKNKGILIPVLIDNVTIPLGFRRIHTLNLTDWKGDLNHIDFNLLLNSIQKIISAHQPSEEPERPELDKDEMEKPRVKEPLPYKKLLMLILVILVVGFSIYYLTENTTKQPPTRVENGPNANDSNWTNAIGMEFKLIRAGEFVRGSPTSEDYSYFDERPVLHVTLANDFYMGKFEVTQKQWYDVMGKKPSYFKYDENLPVESVSWNDTQEFINKYNEGQGGYKYRLPTESEWEYAARAGNQASYFFGNNGSELKNYAWYDENSGGKTHHVGQKKPNQWDLYDMYGNVYEWVQDKYDPNNSVAPTNGSSWEGNKPKRVVRNGGYASRNYSCRSASRGSEYPDEKKETIGFRLVRDL